MEVASTADLVPTLELIKQAVETGELDVQIEAASEKLRDGFGNWHNLDILITFKSIGLQVRESLFKLVIKS